MSLTITDVLGAIELLRDDGYRPGTLYVERESLGELVSGENLVAREDEDVPAQIASVEVRDLPVRMNNARGVLFDRDGRVCTVIA